MQRIKPDLYSSEGGCKDYLQVREGNEEWQKHAKIYWQQQYEKYSSFLDSDYAIKFPNEWFSRLWELTQLDFTTQHQERRIKIIKTHGKVSRPAFCFTHNDESKFYLNAVTARSSPNFAVDSHCSIQLV